MRIRSALVPVALLAPTSAYAQAPAYQVVPLTGLPQPYVAVDLNDAGEVAGLLVDDDAFFVWRQGQPTKTLAFPGAQLVASAIDANGVVVGRVTQAADARVLLWDSRAGTHELVAPPVPLLPWDVNTAGTVVGVDDAGLAGFAWTPSTGAIQTIAFGAPPAQPVGTLGTLAINAAGVAVGGEVVFLPRQGYFEERPYRWTASGGIEELPTLVPGFGGRAMRIDADGDIIGIVRDDAAGEQPALWKAGASAPIPLGVPFGYFVAEPTGMNDDDLVVVVAPNDFFGFTRGFLWANGTYHDLTALQVPQDGLAVSRPVAINGAGTILVQRTSFGGPFIADHALLVAAEAKPTAVLPEVADAGDTITIHGTGLAAVDTVHFTAIVGGFVGVTEVQVAPLAVSDTEVVVQVPLVGAFSPPQAFPPGEAFGSVRVASGGVHSDPLPFGFLEATFGDITTTGVGGSEPAGFSPRSGLDVDPGPTTGQPQIAPMLSGAPEGDVAVLAVGLPAAPPHLPLFGGSLYLDVAFAPLLFVAPATGEHGVTSLVLPLPPGSFGVTLGFQWFTLDPAQGVVSASDLLRALL